MRKTFAAVAILMFAAPFVAAAQIDHEQHPPVKEYDVWFDQWGKVHCADTGTRCTA